MKHIGIFTHNYPRNSQERKDAGVFVYDFAQKLSDDVKVCVFCSDLGGKKEEYKKVPVHWFDWGGTKKKLGNWGVFSPLSIINFIKLMVIGCKKAYFFAKKNKLDYCLAVWALPSSVYTYFIKKKLGIPYAIWCLGSDINKYAKLPILRQLIILCLKEADVIYTNSYSLGKIVGELTGRKSRLLPAITETTSSIIKREVVNRKYFNFLFVGRMERVKGPDLLIESVKLLKNEKRDFRVNILGDGNLLKELRGRVNKYGIDEHVNFCGWANKEKVFLYMKSCDCLIISSRSESLPLVMIEAAKMGLPVISTDVGDCTKLIREYNIGYSVNSFESEDISIAMRQALNKKHEIRKIFSKGLNRLAKDFSLEKSVASFLREIEIFKK